MKVLILSLLLALLHCHGNANEVSLSLVGDSTVTSKPGIGVPKVDTGRPDAIALATGAEDITSCELYGTKSSALGQASVTPLGTATATNLSYKLQTSARANGGHYRTGTCVAGRRIGFSGHDTEAAVDSVASAVVKIHFEGGRANVPYFVKVSREQSGASQIDQLTAPDGKVINLTPSNSPYPVILSKPGQDYFLRTTVSASARNKGGCCSDQSQSSATLSVTVEPAPLLFGGLQTGFIAGGRQTTSYKNVAVILLNGLPHCTATVVSQSTLLTAAHCIKGHITKELLAAGKVTAVFGSVYTEPLFDPVVIVDATYPNTPDMQFDPATLRHDIAVIYTKNPISYTGIKLAAMHDGKPSWAQIKSDQKKLIFVGFGFNVIDNEKVGLGIKREASWGISGYDDLAISFSVPGTNTCMGDSGGPGFLEGDAKLTLVAITSGGDEACTYGFDTRVDSYLPWLTTRLK
jgi:hypothetical protein